MDIGTLIDIGLSFGLMVWAILYAGPLTQHLYRYSLGGHRRRWFNRCSPAQLPFGQHFGNGRHHQKNTLIKEPDTNKLIAQALDFSAKERKSGTLSLQGQIDSIKDKFLVEALHVAVDGQEPSELKAIFTADIDKLAAALLATGAALANVLFIPIRSDRPVLDDKPITPIPF